MIKTGHLPRAVLVLGRRSGGGKRREEFAECHLASPAEWHNYADVIYAERLRVRVYL